MSIVQGDNGIRIPFTVYKTTEVFNLESAVVRVVIKQGSTFSIKQALILDAYKGKCALVLLTGDLSVVGEYSYQWTVYLQDGRIISGNPTSFIVKELYVSVNDPETPESPTIIPFATIDDIKVIQDEIDILKNSGVKGDTGPTGNDGAQGIPGIQGERGLQGVQGIQGLKGDPGTNGLKGDAGIQGTTGIQGLKGEDGIQGIKGDQGIQGIQGIQGPKGDAAEGGVSGGRLVGSFRSTPQTWNSNLFSIDTFTDIITVVGHGLSIGDQVMFTYQKGRSSSLPAGIIGGKVYFIREVEGDNFKVSADNTDTAYPNITNMGIADFWRMERTTSVNSITINGFDLKRLRVIIRDGGFTGTFPAVSLRLNGIVEDVYYHAYQSGSGLGNSLILYNAGAGSYPIRFVGMIDIQCAGNQAIVTLESGYEGVNGTNGSNITGYSTGTAAQTYSDDRFLSITSITVMFGSCIVNGDLTVEVYEL